MAGTGAYRPSRACIDPVGQAMARPSLGAISAGGAMNTGKRGKDGAPGGIRTPDQWLRKPLLYPAELRARCVLHPAGPPDGATDRQSGAGGAFYP